MSVDRQERDKWFAALFKEGSDWKDEKRSHEFWGTGIDYIFADRRLSSWIEKNPPAWRAILADADPVFANASVRIYKRRSLRPALTPPQNSDPRGAASTGGRRRGLPPADVGRQAATG